MNIPTVETCRTCHNEQSPTYKHFCFACRTSKIRHLNPTRRTPEEVEAMHAAAREACDCESACGADVCRHQQ